MHTTGQNLHPSSAEDAPRSYTENSSQKSSSHKIKDRKGAVAPPVDIKIENEEHEAAQTQEDAPTPSKPTLDTIPTKPAGPSAEALAAHRLAVEEAEKQRQERLAQREALKGVYAAASKAQDERTQRETAIKRALKQAEPGSAEAEDLQRQRMTIWEEILAGQKELAEIDRAYRDLEG